MRASEFEPHTLQLTDGRRLAYATLGPASGIPILYLHGGIGTALTPEPALTEAVERLGVQWVALSRPGFGGSQPHPRRSLMSVADDARELAAARGWRRVAVVGVSSGGPYALACAARAPELVGAVGLAATLSGRTAPHEVPGLPVTTRLFLRALLHAPHATGRVLGVLARALRRHERLIAGLAGPDRAPGVRALSGAVEHGVDGIIGDFLTAARPWAVDLSRIEAEVHLWHGLRDTLSPVEHCWQLAAELPRCRMWLSPTETHFFFRRRSAEIAEQLVTALRLAEQEVAWAARATGEDVAQAGCIPGLWPSGGATKPGGG